MRADDVSDFEGMRLVRRRGGSALIGVLADQAALHGVLARLDALGLTLVEVRRGAIEEASPDERPEP
jgi:hypothetical protein